MANIISFEATGIIFSDSPISEVNKIIPCEEILNLKELDKETKDTNIFISIKKNSKGNFILYYKKKYHRDVLTIVEYLPVVMSK